MGGGESSAQGGVGGWGVGGGERGGEGEGVAGDGCVYGVCWVTTWFWSLENVLQLVLIVLATSYIMHAFWIKYMDHHMLGYFLKCWVHRLK